MGLFFISALLAAAAVTTACVIPTDTLSNNITTGFGILIQNPAFPVIHDRYMNLDPAGGGDQHLFLAPVGDPTFNLVLSNGILEQDIIHAVIDGEYSAVDNTTKMFMTNRGDPKAIFSPAYGCDPDTDDVQIQLAFQTREDSPFGGLICVRIASGNRGYEFRYSPPDNPAFDPTNPCMPVTMVVVPGGSAMSSSAAATSGSSTSTTITGGVTTTSSTALSTPTGPTQPATVNGIWTWYGCRTEATNMRALSLATFAADTMTLEACGTFCAAGSYTYFGTEYARECYCGNSFNPGSVPAPATDCSFECMGNSLEYCGAGQRLSVYTMNGVSQSPSLSGSSTSSTSSISASPSPTGPQTVTTLAGWNYLGCYTEATTGRALNGILLPIPAAVTDVETCAAACSAYTYFGVEYGQECYCGDFLNAGSVNSITVPNSNPCNIVCANNANEYCGGRSVLNLYQVAISSSSTLSSTSSSTTSSSVSSVSSSSSSSTASPSSSTTVSSSSTTSTVSSSSSSSSTSSFSTASSSPLPYTDMTANGFAFLGCAPEDTHATDGPGRTLSGTLYADDAMTDGKCMAFCLSHGYAFAGTEYTRECWCGNSVAPGREPQTTIASLAGCNFPCGGDSTQYCGGSGWLSLYQACTVGSACVNAQFT